MRRPLRRGRPAIRLAAPRRCFAPAGFGAAVLAEAFDTDPGGLGEGDAADRAQDQFTTCARPGTAGPTTKYSWQDDLDDGLVDRMACEFWRDGYSSVPSSDAHDGRARDLVVEVGFGVDSWL
jgi:hypothetical protein